MLDERGKIDSQGLATDDLLQLLLFISHMHDLFIDKHIALEVSWQIRDRDFKVQVFDLGI